MMSKKQLACMLALHIIYILFGTGIFYYIESPKEVDMRNLERVERAEIQNLLDKHYIPGDPDEKEAILRKLSDYCGKPMYNNTDEDPPFKWDFYHSFFFSYTVVSTIGYGNLAPTTDLSRILMIFYALFGIPINGILLANLGEYFGLQLVSVYRKYKKKNEKSADNLHYFFHNLGLLGQIILCLIPGFLFFIFLPACIFVVFEKWDFIAAVYFAFVTLTTIGFGDLVAGTNNNGFSSGYYFAYQLFLVVWIIFGLGYIVMLLGFITSGMRSERVHKIEHKLACQLRSTQNKILHGLTKDMAILRKIINEANLIKIKPVYIKTCPHLHRSISCPNLTFDIEPRYPAMSRRRANSESIYLTSKDIVRIQSDTDLLGIDKDRTFTANAILKPAELFARVVNVLGGMEQAQENKGINLFKDEEILASEKPVFKIGSDIISTYNMKRNRAQSVVAVPSYRKDSVLKMDHDFTWTNGDTAEKYRKEANMRCGKSRGASKEDGIFPQPIRFLSKLFLSRQNSNDNPSEVVKSSMKHRASIAQATNENVFDKSLYFKPGKENECGLNSGQRDTKARRHSIFPTFDFSSTENNTNSNVCSKKLRKHSIFPTFDFTSNASEKHNSSKCRHSIFPTFDFSFNEPNKNNEYTQNDEIETYKTRTRTGRFSLFPTFGRPNNENSMENSKLGDSSEYKYKTSGRNSLHGLFDRDIHIPNQTKGLKESIKQYQDSTKLGRRSLNVGDISHYKDKHLTDWHNYSDMKEFKYPSKARRQSLYDNSKQSNIINLDQDDILEQTSVADLLRALVAVETSATTTSLGLANQSNNLTPENNLDINSHLTPFNNDLDDNNFPRRRKISNRPSQFTPTLPTVVAGTELQTTSNSVPNIGSSIENNLENTLSQSHQIPIPDSNNEELKPTKTRRYSSSASTVKSASGPVPRLFSRIRKESCANSEEDAKTEELTDIKVDDNL